MSPGQLAFLKDEFFSMTLMATVQRGRLYRKDSSEAEKKAFRLALRSQLEGFAEHYKTRISERCHLANIETLASTLSSAHESALNEGRFRIGSAQKSLNLYLKYMWCVGRIPMPPHCPFDFRVLSRLPECRDIRWTKLDSVTEYRRIVGHAKTAAGDNSIAEWELREYNAAQLSARKGRAASGAPQN